MKVTSLIKTRHFEQRTNQRAIRSKQVEMALELGKKKVDGKVVLGRKQIDKELGLLEEAKKTLLQIKRRWNRCDRSRWDFVDLSMNLY